MQGHKTDPIVASALAKLEPLTQFLTVLGSYPEA
jgi:prephenate dehydratase